MILGLNYCLIEDCEVQIIQSSSKKQGHIRSQIGQDKLSIKSIILDTSDERS